jgi:hypothetical protein
VNIRQTQQFFSFMMAVSIYWWNRELRYIVQCIWGEITDLQQVNWQTFSHSHIGTNRIRTDAGWRWEASWYETDILTTEALYIYVIIVHLNNHNMRIRSINCMCASIMGLCNEFEIAWYGFRYMFSWDIAHSVGFWIFLVVRKLLSPQ